MIALYECTEARSVTALMVAVEKGAKKLLLSWSLIRDYMTQLPAVSVA